MAVNIAQVLSAYANAPKPEIGADVQATGGAQFSDMLAQTLNDAVAATSAGEQAIQMGAAGKANLVDVVTAVADAEVTLETVVAMRDRVIGAYQEIMRMPI
jgi:flagellar hook-basal body complex protein FliE